MSAYAQCIQDLISELSRLPGIGPKSAERITFHLLKSRNEDVMRLAQALQDMKTKVRHCEQCFNLAEEDLCSVCKDSQRDPSIVLVVEQPRDLMALENPGTYRGLYHVLLGRIAPLEGVRPEDLTVAGLATRLQAGTVKELILGTNPNVEGDGTALYIEELVTTQFPGVQLSRLARGLPTGSSIEHANRNILADAISGRQQVKPR
jgi:recombination protein RecR